jgi:hypothetical protein
MGYPQVKELLKARIYKQGDYTATKEDLRALIDAAPEKDGSVALETALAFGGLMTDISEFSRIDRIFKGQGIDAEVPPGLAGAVKFENCGELSEFGDFIQKNDVMKAKSMYADIYEDLSG